MARIICPTCKSLLELQDAALGKQFRCPTCSTTLFVPSPLASGASTPASNPGPGQPNSTEIKPKPTTKTAEMPPSASKGEERPKPLTRTDSKPKPSQAVKSAATKSFRVLPGPGDGNKSNATPGTEAQPAAASASATVLEVTARPAGGKTSRRRSPILNLAAALLVFVLPVGAAGIFVAFNWYQGEFFGAIEIGSKGIKYVHFEVFPDKDLGQDFDVRKSDTTNTDIVKDMEKTKTFNPAGLEDTVSAVRVFYKRLTGEYKLPPENIYVVGSSGLFSAINTNKDLTREEKAKLVKDNQKTLAGQVEKVIGKKLEFVNVDEEAEFQVRGVVGKKDLDSALCIDVGGGGTRGGYQESSGVLKKMEGPGVSKYRGLVKSRSQDLASFTQQAADLADQELHEPFRQQVERNPGLRQRDKIYLVGGIVWVMANYTHPTQRGRYVKLDANDIEVFARRARDNPNLINEFEPPATLTAREQDNLREEIKRMRVYFPPESVLAGAEVLKALSAELHFADKKEMSFYRNGDHAWVLEYVGEKSRAGK